MSNVLFTTGGRAARVLYETVVLGGAAIGGLLAAFIVNPLLPF
jgi:hypothetical protein